MIGPRVNGVERRPCVQLSHSHHRVPPKNALTSPSRKRRSPTHSQAQQRKGANSGARPDIQPLAKALQAEFVEKAPSEKRWYGSSSTLYEDHPARMASPPFLQLRWQVVPRAQTFLDALRAYTTIADPVSISEDFTNLQGLSREEQEKGLRELKQRGETIAAIYMARRIYGCGLEQARTIVEHLRDDTHA